MLFHRLLSHSLSVPIPSLRVARRQTGSGQEAEPVREGAEPPGCITFWVGKKKKSADSGMRASGGGEGSGRPHGLTGFCCLLSSSLSLSLLSCSCG